MLTVTQIRSLKPADRPYKVADVDGLYLLVQPSGALLWRFRNRCCGIERKLSLALLQTSRFRKQRTFVMHDELRRSRRQHRSCRPRDTG